MAPQGQRRRLSPTETWSTYRQAIGDRSGLFAAIADSWGPKEALYPGCYLDLSPSTAIPAVTYVDTDNRAARYFDDRDMVLFELGGRARPGAGLDLTFLQSDYTLPLPLADGGFDLLISLYAGPVWDHCARHLRPGGLLLANASHGDASIAALDPRLQCVAAVQSRGGRFSLDVEDLDTYLVPSRPDTADPEAIRRNGRGIRYTRPAFAYVFRLD